MADQSKVQYDKDLESYVQKMLDSGASQDQISQVVRAYDDMQHPFKAMAGGAVEGGMEGVLGAITAPWDLAKTVVPDLWNLAHGDTSLSHTGQFVNGMADLPRQWNEGGPRERAKLLASALVLPAAGYAEGNVVGKPALRTTGKVMQAAGEHPFATRMASGAAMVHGIYTGDPMEMGAGVVGAAIPPVLAKTGQQLRIWGGESPAVVRLGPKGVAAANEQFDNAMASRNVAFADEEAAIKATANKAAIKQKANADRLATIQDAAAGRTESAPSISRSFSADTTDGGRTSMSIRMQPPEGAKGGGIGLLSAEEVAGLRKPGFADDVIKRIATGEGTTVNPPAPRVVPTGKAAADLANGPVTKARPPYNQQAAAENIANGSSYNNGHVLQDPKPTELSDLATEGPDTGMVYDAEHGVAVPKDLSFEAGHPDVPGLTVGEAKTNPLSNRPAPKGSIRVGKGPLDDILGPEGPKGAFDWPEAGGRFEPDATGSHVLKSSRTPASNFGEFMNQLDEAMGGAKSKSKKGSGQWKNLSDNDATTAANAYSTGVRNPEEVIQAILDKRKARQSVHIESHYANQQQIPE